MIISFLFRFAALNKYEAPPSCDYGNYLTQVDVLHGFDVENLGLRYNPLFFILLDAFLRLFDTFTALKIVASLVFSIATIPFFLLAKEISGNYIAALMCTWLFIFYEWYSEMIAWGGNPNFLGISFMLLTIFFLVKLFEKPSKKNILFAGFFLSLAIGTHLLVAFLMTLTFILFIVLKLIFQRKNEGKTIKSLIYFISIAAVFSLPYFSFYMTFFRYSSGGLLGINFSIQFTATFFESAWTFLSQNLIIIIIVALGIFALAKFIKQKKNTGILLCSLSLAPLIFASITEHPGRWFYFLPIPIFLCFCLYLKDLFLAIRNVRREILVLALCFILIIGIEMGVASTNRLKGAVDWYQSIGSDEIQALNWIKNSSNTPSNATFITSGPNRREGEDSSPGHIYSWWIEGLAKRKSLHTGSALWYTYTDERANAAIANKIFAGTYVFEYGDIEMSESFNSSLGNPSIGIPTSERYQNILFLRDDAQELFFSPVGNESTTLLETPFSAEKTLNFDYNETWANVRCTYEWPYLKVIRSTIVGLEQSSVDVIFEVSPVNSILRQFNINFWASNFTSLSGYEINNSTITLHQALFSKAVTTQISIVQTNCELLNSTVLYQGSQRTPPLATFSLQPLNTSMYVHIRMSFTTTASEANNQTLNFYDSYSLIKDLGVDYLFLNKDRTIEYQRFLNDPEHFTIKFQNKTIAIFKVNY